MNLPIDFQKLISLQRIFEITPEPIGNYLFLIILFGALFILAIFLKFYAKRKKNIYSKVYSTSGSLLLFLSLTATFLIFMRWQSIPYIGSRFVLLVVVAIGLFWFINILLYLFITIPKKQKIKQEKENFEKYLPRPTRVKAGLPRTKSRG